MSITGAQVVAFAAGLGTFLLVLELVRQRQLREKYAAMWLLLAVGMTILAFFPGMLVGVADVLDFNEPATVLSFVGLLVLFGVAVHVSWELSRLESETRALAEELALLRLEVQRHAAKRDT